MWRLISSGTLSGWRNKASSSNWRGLVAYPLIFGNLEIRCTSTNVAKGAISLLISRLSLTLHCILCQFLLL
ncbi:hypothetical protein SLEP1_g41257 [Rubroshorea leprosula]|uniref:Uncharacterized protein n=1 Tax=Rubroshorea leprosula TaxID=152421 RepID=A0AAV5L5Z4_9ROSI|nr:hypothetical protein SLEP1_g41257 [Rubroshorea leprosula]